MERRPVRLDREDALYELRPRVGKLPAERTRLGVREKDRRTDLVEKRDARFAIQPLDHPDVGNVLHLGREELVEDRIARDAGPRPLRVELRLRIRIPPRRSREPLGHRLRIRPARLAVHLGEESRAGARGLIDDVHGIPTLKKIIAPTGTPVGRAHEVRSGLPAAVPHHDRIGLGAALGDLVLHVHLAAHHVTVARLRVAASDEEVALLCDRQHTRLLWRAGRLRTTREHQRERAHRCDELHRLRPLPFILRLHCITLRNNGC
jgi:hypothetical protein